MGSQNGATATDATVARASSISQPVELLDAAIDVATATTRTAIAASLRELSDRLANDRLHLAVLGQFKRGKSTLLNALIGAEVLPMGVLPVTAIPTFVESGPARELEIEFKDGRTELSLPADLPFLRRRLADVVTEEGNPENVLGVARVRVRQPSDLLGLGVILIDTPGVGSTFQHNTAAAEASLPACDAGLLVVSSDPPITQVELSYIDRIRENASHLLVILNKADLAEPGDLEKASGFLRRVLTEQAGLDSPEIFPVSAKRALEAKLTGDTRALAESGLETLEHRLSDLVASERRAILKAAVARKARTLVGALGFELGLEQKALLLPLSNLEARRAAFGEAITGFEAERQLVRDLLAADQQRCLDRIESDAVALRSRLATKIGAELEAGSREMARAWDDLRRQLPNRFGRELQLTLQGLRQGLEDVFSRHRARADALIDHVRQTAAEVMDVPFEAQAELTGFEAQFLPQWVVERPEALNPLPPGAAERLLPALLRRPAERRRIKRELDEIMLRNVENLRWAMRQNVQDTFRKFGSEMDALFEAGLAATRDVMDAAIEQRRRREADSVQRLETLTQAIAQLQAIQEQLAHMQE